MLSLVKMSWAGLLSGPVAVSCRNPSTAHCHRIITVLRCKGSNKTRVVASDLDGLWLILVGRGVVSPGKQGVVASDSLCDSIPLVPFCHNFTIYKMGLTKPYLPPINGLF